jgi:type IV pilus assembly protein PilF
MNDLAAAEDYLEKATRYGPRGVTALMPLAEIKYRRGEFDEARRLLGEFHRASDASPESLGLALRIERRLGDRNAEASFTAQLRRRFPDSRESQELKRGTYE